MIKEQIQKIVSKAVSQKAEIFVPENEKFGHYSTNVALKLAKRENNPPAGGPMEIATNLKSQISNLKSDFFEKIEVVQPGFINFWLSDEVLRKELKEILEKKEKYGQHKAKSYKLKTINIEFISANPTGPLTIGNGRGGFFGDALANILKFNGYNLVKEYYVNDAKNSTQIKELGKTGLGKGTTYLTKNLKSQISNLKNKIKKIKSSGAPDLYGETGYLLAQKIQKENKNFIGKKLKIKFDKWFSEQSLYDKSSVEKTLNELKKKNLVYEKDGALWFKSSGFGDSEDRVLIRSTGEPARNASRSDAGGPTYFLPDLAYHWNKFKIRKFNKVIDIWGADHHGYIPRLKAGIKALGIDEKKLTILITQLARLLKGGKEFKVSKRKGAYVTMEDLIKEIGLDASRFFFLMSAPDTHMNFNLDLAKERSMKNPVYYVQYASVRCQGILRKSNLKSQISKINFKLLNTKEDLDLIRILARFPEIIEEAAQNYNPQTLVRYSIELAKQFHNFYEKERVIGEEKELAAARLALVLATLIVFKNIFSLLGISMPKKM
ncbi:arginine--tRNA ligase [Candidatus Wolfebacteria bacterium]|nr:arginine--tRNA ligase [Candidatus Wolfebacteria bacterium]